MIEQHTFSLHPQSHIEVEIIEFSSSFGVVIAHRFGRKRKPCSIVTISCNLGVIKNMERELREGEIRSENESGTD